MKARYKLVGFDLNVKTGEGYTLSVAYTINYTLHLINQGVARNYRRQKAMAVIKRIFKVVTQAGF
jgi:hypothetical protein